MRELIIIFLSAIIIHNVILNRFIGLCPFIGVSRGVKISGGMGMGVIFVLTMASIVTWLVYHYILVPLDLVYMRTIAFILVIAALVQLIEIIISKASPALHRALGIYLPLITTNCAVLGIAILNIEEGYNIVQTTVHAIGASLGFTLALMLIASIRARFRVKDIPRVFEGAPITFISAGILAIAFMGFVGMIK